MKRKIIESIITSIIILNIITIIYNNKTNNNLYILEYATFIDKKTQEKYTNKIDNYLLINDNNKYKIILGIYTNKKIANKYKNILENNNIYVIIKNEYNDNNNLINNIKSEEYKIKINNNNNKIKEINKKILKIYEEKL